MGTQERTGTGRRNCAFSCKIGILPSSNDGWEHQLCIPNQCTAWLPTATCSKMNASHLNTFVRNPKVPSHAVDTLNGRRTRKTSQRKILYHTSKNLIAQEASSSWTRQVHVEQEVQGLHLQIDLWQAWSGVQTMPQILCRVRRVCEQEQQVKKQLMVHWGRRRKDRMKIINWLW